MKALWFRILAYLGMVSMLAVVLFMEAWLLPRAQHFSESGFVEISQQALLLLSLFLVLLQLWRSLHPEPLLRIMALLFAALLIRESDQLLEIWLPHGFWKWPVSVLLVFMGLIVMSNRELLRAQILRLARLPAFGVMISGFGTLVFSRFFGWSDFWKAFMGERYWREVARAAEESIELLALGLLFAGAVELILSRKRAVAIETTEPGATFQY